MITTPLIKESEKQRAKFNRRIFGIALLAFALLSCFAFSVSNGTKESTVAAAETAVGEGTFVSIGMELEFHNCFTNEDLGYDTLLYTSGTQVSIGQPLFTIVAETARNVEMVTGVIMENNEGDKEMLRRFISVGKALSTKNDKSHAQVTSITQLGKIFEAQKDSPGTVAVDNDLTWEETRSPWAPQITAQGSPTPHLRMLNVACDAGTRRNWAPPPAEAAASDWLKLQHIIQEEMCNAVNRYLTTPKVKETKEALCFLAKATNIEEVLKRGASDFKTWCLAKNKPLAAATREGPHTGEPGANDYEKTVVNLLKWATGQWKIENLGKDPGFPTATEDTVRIEYRQARNFAVLQQPIRGAPAAKTATGLAVVNALFNGCVPKMGEIEKVAEQCSLAK